MNALTTAGLGRAPARKHRRLFQDRVRAPQLKVLLAQPLELLALIRGQPFPLAGIDLGPADVLAQRLGTDPQILGDMSDRTLAL
jgi:hypothetical protein